MLTRSFNPVPLLKTRLDLLRSLRSLSVEQLDLIALGNSDDVAGIIEVKEAVILRLQIWQRENNQLLEKWEQIESHLDPQVRRTCEELRRLSEMELAALRQNEQTTRLQLQELRDRTQQELSSMNRGAETLSAYERTSLSPVQSAFDVNH